MYLLLQTTIGGKFPIYFVLVYVIGFIAFVSIGLIAYYNSKLPAGRENAQKPDFIPDLNLEKSSETETEK